MIILFAAMASSKNAAKAKASNSLAARFNNLLNPTEVAHQNPENMSIEELANMKISFGEAKRGQTYQEVLQGDPRYVSWFLARYQDSPKPVHKSLVAYITRCVEEEEQSRGTTTSASHPLQAQAKAKSATSRPATAEETELWVDEARWDMIEDETRDQEIALQSQRLDRVEAALQQILQVLTPSTPHLESTNKGPAGYSLPEKK